MSDSFGIISITNENFSSEIEHSDKPVLIDFYADWCGPCRMVSSMLNDLSAKFIDKLKVVKIDTDQVYELSSKYNVTALPTLILLNNGQEQKRFIGNVSKNQIELEVNNLLLN